MVTACVINACIKQYSLQPVAEIAERIHSIKRVHDYECKILIHTDAAQAIGKIPVNVEDLSVDYLTIVGHKARNTFFCLYSKLFCHFSVKCFA